MMSTFIYILVKNIININLIIKSLSQFFLFQVLFSHKEPPLELLDTDAKVGENISYVTFGELCIFRTNPKL